MDKIWDNIWDNIWDSIWDSIWDKYGNSYVKIYWNISIIIIPILNEFCLVPKEMWFVYTYNI